MLKSGETLPERAESCQDMYTYARLTTEETRNGS
jgi:hypothetical protein